VASLPVNGMASTKPAHIFIIFYIQFWYLRCCGCPRLRGRQHLAMTCHNTEAGFLTAGTKFY